MLDRYIEIVVPADQAGRLRELLSRDQAVATFLVQGVRPRRSWEAERSKRIARKMLLVWAVLLLALAGLVYLSRVWCC
jgi:hypothetical protein